MITQEYKYYVTGTAPFTWSVIDTNQLDCLIITPANGVSEDGYISFTASSNSGTCFDEVALVLTVTDIENCILTYNIITEDPCSTFTVGPIMHQGNFVFNVSVTGGTLPYTYTWNWDNNIFKLADSNANLNTNYLALELNTNVPPITSGISVLVKDFKNCETLVTYNYNFCTPEALDTSVTLVCDKKKGISLNDNVFLNILECPSEDEIELDWYSLTFNTPYNVFVEHYYKTNPNAPVNKIKIYTGKYLLQGLYEIKYTIADQNGVVSNVGTIYVTVPECLIPMNVYIPNQVIQIPCGTNAGDTIEIPICDLPVPSDAVDWTSFEFLSSGTTTATSPLGVTEGYPDNLTYSAKGCTIFYTVPATTGTDSFQWQISSLTGGISNATITAIYLDCPNAPVAVDDTTCATCGNPVTIDVLANDTIAGGADIFPQSLQITEMPVNGTAFIDTNWRIIYTPNINYQGTETIKYKVGNNAVPVVFSNEGTVTVTVLCAGQPGVITVC